HWWEQLLHNQSALRLKARLLLQPGVIVASVPYQLRSARAEAQRLASAAPPGGKFSHVTTKPSGMVDFSSRAAAPDAHEGGLARLRHHIAAANEQIQAEELQARVADIKATPISDLADRDQAEVVGTLRTVTVRPQGNSPTLQAELWDGSGSVTLVWLGRRSIPGIEPGRHLKVTGRVAHLRGARTIFNPGYELGPPGGETAEPVQVNR
ncbi:MAG TPA: OB-fold nucleic acid binding domain-containing protein, partial [Streptosporangiaceae bacterium]